MLSRSQPDPLGAQLSERLFKQILYSSRDAEEVSVLKTGPDGGPAETHFFCSRETENLRCAQGRVILVSAISASYEDIVPQVEVDDAMQAESKLRLGENNVAFPKSGELHRSDFNELPVTNCWGHARATRLKANGQPLPEHGAQKICEQM